MKKLLGILILFSSHFSIMVCHAQHPIIDSLKLVLKTEEEDTNKVNTLNVLSEKLWKISKYDSSMFYASGALALANNLEFEKGKANAFRNMGICYWYKGNYSSALNNFQEGLSVYREIGNKQGVANCLNNIGNIYDNLGNYPKSLEYFFRSLALCQELKNEGRSAVVLGNIGNIYYFQQNWPKTLEYYFKALAIQQKAGDMNNVANNLGNIGNVYDALGKQDSALEYEFKALDIDRKIGDKEGESRNLGNIGQIYTAQKKYEQALEYEFRGLVINRKIGNKRFYGYDLNSIGNIYALQKKYVLSKIYLDSALLLSLKMGEKDLIKKVYNNKAELDSAQGDYKAELQDNKYYSIYRDSLSNEKTVRQEMNLEYSRKADSAKAEQDKILAIAAKESQRQKVIRNSFIAGFSIAFVAAGLFFFQRRKIAKEKKRSDELLLNILPEETAEELKVSGESKARSFDMVTVMFTDFKNFTSISEKLSSDELVAELHYLFHAFDNITEKYGLEKIKTIGDSYMAAGGLPVPNKTNAKDAVMAALEIQQFLMKHNTDGKAQNKPLFEARIGINTGPVVAGIVGIRKFSYDIWGDTVNLASRMEQSGETGKVNISGSTYQYVKNDFNCTYRGKIEAKNKGEIDMYFVE